MGQHDEAAPEAEGRLANLTGLSFGEWLASRPLGHAVHEETAKAMEMAWYAGREQAGIPRPTPEDIRARLGLPSNLAPT
jgi:hypothetical protein